MQLRYRLKRCLRRSNKEPGKASSEQAITDEDDNLDPFNPFPDPIRIEITDVFDLHTVAPSEVKAVVEEYLVEAHRNGFRSVRIIHGKGIGVQRKLVQSILARSPFVKAFIDAPPGAGGWGATIAHLSFPEE